MLPFHFSDKRKEGRALTESDILKIAQDSLHSYKRMRCSPTHDKPIPDPPSYIFDWDEEQDMIDMTGLHDIHLTS